MRWPMRWLPFDQKLISSAYDISLSSVPMTALPVDLAALAAAPEPVVGLDHLPGHPFHLQHHLIFV